MWAICKREFKSLFNNIVGWLFVGVTLATFGMYFFAYNLYNGYPYVAYTLSSCTFLFMITVPILTMRLYAEERKNKIDQLILTSPVKIGKIVVGKYLSVALTFAICMAVICITPLILMPFGDVPVKESYIAILGFFLYGLTALAIGCFISSLTENVVIAAVVSFVVIFIGYIMKSLTSLLGDGVVSKIFGAYDLYSPVEDMFNGILGIKSVFYYVSVIAFTLFLTYEVIQKRRFTISKNTISKSAYSVVTIVVVTAALILSNFGVTKIPTKYSQYDGTKQDLYSISDTTKDYLKTLDQDVTIYLYSTKSNRDDLVVKTLNNFKQNSKHITVKYIDPSKNPTFASQYTEQSLSENSLVVEGKKISKVIDFDSIYAYEMDYSTYQYTITGYDGEGQIVSALQYVTSDNLPKVYQLTGHDELSLKGDFLEVVEKANIQLEDLNLLQVDAVPEDCEALIISGPTSDFSKDDAKKISEYISGGGKVFLTLEYDSIGDEPNIASVFNAYGINVVNGIVGERDKDYYYSMGMYLLPFVESTSVSSSVTGNSSLFVPNTVAFTYKESEEYEIESLMTTSEDAIVKTLDNLSKHTSKESNSDIFKKESGDTEGQFSLGLSVVNNNGGSLIVCGSQAMFEDAANEVVSGRNAKFFTDIMSYFVTTDETATNTVVIPVKDYSLSQLTVSESAKFVVGLIFGMLVPILIIIAGIVFWAIRRKK